MLNKCALSLLILFNRRRIGDVQYLKITDYKEDRRSDYTDFENALTEAEKVLTTQYKRVINSGKGSRAVVILVPKEIENSILCNKIYKRHFRHVFYVRHERSVAERVFNKQVSREVYKRVEYYTFSTTKLTNGTHKRNKQFFY
jgi:hypothetical protein